MPAVSPGSASLISTCQPRDSAQRWYIRSSMFAQSHDSVPPAPALMLRMQLFLSCGPLRKTLQFQVFQAPWKIAPGRASISFSSLACSASGSPSAEFDHHPEILHLLLGLEQRVDFLAEGVGLVNELLRLLAVVPESVRRPSRTSSSASRFCVLGTSKKPPQMREFLRHGRQLNFNGFKHIDKNITTPAA